MDIIIEDKQLGRLVIRANPRVRRLVLRSKRDAIYISVPPGTPMAEVERAIEKHRDWLADTREKLARPLIDLDYRIETEYFKLSLVPGNREKFLAHSEPGHLQIVCPPGTDFADRNLQEWLHKVVVEGVRSNAKAILPARLQQLASQHGFDFKSVKINSSQGRWGSCSGLKDINLSCYILLLPPHLIDYVLLHELCHTRVMNHSKRYWALLDEVSGGQSDAYLAELNMYYAEV